MRPNIIINCGPCEDYIGLCLDSLRAQAHRDFEAFVTIDACADDTANRAWAARGGDGRIDISVNIERRYAMSNLVHAIRRHCTKLLRLPNIGTQHVGHGGADPIELRVS